MTAWEKYVKNNPEVFKLCILRSWKDVFGIDVDNVYIEGSWAYKRSKYQGPRTIVWSFKTHEEAIECYHEWRMLQGKNSFIEPNPDIGYLPGSYNEKINLRFSAEANEWEVI